MEFEIPAFISALWKMVEDPETDEIIRWGEDGRHFVICNDVEFVNSLLPVYYKHNKFSSFIRQLNTYGFHKTAGKIDSVKNVEHSFSHPYFQKGEKHLLHKIKKKSSSCNKIVLHQPLRVTENICDEIRTLQFRQIEVNRALKALQAENSILWQQLVMLRQRQKMQQPTLNKAVRFLVALLHRSTRDGRPIFSGKRKPLIITGNLSPSKKLRNDFQRLTIRELDSSDQPVDGPQVETDTIQDEDDTSEENPGASKPNNLADTGLTDDVFTNTSDLVENYTSEVNHGSPKPDDLDDADLNDDIFAYTSNLVENYIRALNHGSPKPDDLDGAGLSDDAFTYTFDLGSTIQLLNELDLTEDGNVPNIQPEIVEENISSCISNLNEEYVDSQDTLLNIMKGGFNNTVINIANGKKTETNPDNWTVATCSNNGIDTTEKRFGMTQNEVDEIKKIFTGCKLFEVAPLRPLVTPHYESNYFSTWRVEMRKHFLSNAQRFSRTVRIDPTKKVKMYKAVPDYTTGSEVAPLIPKIIDFNEFLESIEFSDDTKESKQTKTLKTPKIRISNRKFFKNKKK